MVTLDEKLSNLKLETHEVSMIKKEAFKDTAKEVGSSLASTITGGISDIFSPLLSINSEINDRIKETKQAYLLNEYINKVDDIEQAFEDLKNIIADQYGNVIVNQLFKILEGFPPDKETISLLGSTLQHIIAQKHYKELFNQYQLHLRLFQRISAQALYLISCFEQFKSFEMNVPHGKRRAEDGTWRLEGDWSIYFVKEMNLEDGAVSVVNELIDNHLIYATQSESEEGKMFYIALTQDGMTLFNYIH
ncbi:hypothetical protein Si119_01385 [Streptococcus infantarius subsp. infantarius]|nr:hypothetical protein [Streptococcus infantarius subsp. infantarius]